MLGWQQAWLAGLYARHRVVRKLDLQHTWASILYYRYIVYQHCVYTPTYSVSHSSVWNPVPSCCDRSSLVGGVNHRSGIAAKIKRSELKHEVKPNSVCLYLGYPETGLRRGHKVEKQYESQQLIKLKLPGGLFFGSQLFARSWLCRAGVEGWGIVAVGSALLAG